MIVDFHFLPRMVVVFLLCFLLHSIMKCLFYLKWSGHVSPSVTSGDEEMAKKTKTTNTIKKRFHDITLLRYRQKPPHESLKPSGHIWECFFLYYYQIQFLITSFCWNLFFLVSRKCSQCTLKHDFDIQCIKCSVDVITPICQQWQQSSSQVK